MTELILRRQYDPPKCREDVLEMAVQGDNCFSLHRVDWNMSLLSADGRNLFCHFSGRDSESVRAALRQLGANIQVLVQCTVHDRPGLVEPVMGSANVIVERHFDGPVDLDEIQAIEDEGAWCLETYTVVFLRTFFSTNRCYMACLYSAPDAESVRQAQRMARMPFDKVWSFVPLTPADIPRS